MVRTVLSRTRPTFAALGAVALAATLAACVPVRASGGGADPTHPASMASIVVRPGGHAQHWDPSQPVILTVSAGRFTKVVVHGGGAPVKGHFLSGGTAWASTQPLAYATKYRVVAAAVDANGQVARSRSSFQTVHPTSMVSSAITPSNGWTVGIGMPIIVTFDHPVADRASVERLLSVQTRPAVVGGWYWVGDQMVRWRPRSFWPAGARVHVQANLAGANLGSGQWGAADNSVDFRIGAATIDTVDIAADTLTVKQDGAVIRSIPVTTGKPGWDTRVGTKVIMSRQSEVTMDAATLDVPKNSPDYYRLKVQYAMRLTWSGEYLHAAPWSVADQGVDNVSHGCTGMSTDNAKWLFDFSKVGDPVIYVNGTRPMEPWNGYTDWNLSWSQWQAGSALR
jgi:lipoprotein-anchoring transpeptidase ErfK/SrfK